MAQTLDPEALCPCPQHNPLDDWSGWISGDNPTQKQIKQSWQDWANVHDRVMFNASVDPGQLAPWQHVKGLITNDDVMVLVQRAARTPLRELLMPFRHLRLCDCRVKRHTIHTLWHADWTAQDPVT
jgi:hypothetical protein